MKKFLNIKTGIIAAVVLLLSVVTVSASFALMPRGDKIPSDYDKGLTFEQAAKEDKPILAVFYVDWCTYCKRFMPKLDAIRSVHNDFNFVLINVEDSDNEKFVKEYKIGSFPTVYIIEPKYDNRVHIDNAFLESVLTLNKELARYSGYKKALQSTATCR